MAMDFDSQLIESVEVRRNRLTTSLLFGVNPTERRWKDRTALFVYGLVVAALVCAFCVAISFVVMVLTNWLQEREERERLQEQRQQQVSAPWRPAASPVPDAGPGPGPVASPSAPGTPISAGPLSVWPLTPERS